MACRGDARRAGRTGRHVEERTLRPLPLQGERPGGAAGAHGASPRDRRPGDVRRPRGYLACARIWCASGSGGRQRAGLPGGCPVAAGLFEFDDVEGEVRSKIARDGRRMAPAPDRASSGAPSSWDTSGATSTSSSSCGSSPASTSAIMVLPLSACRRRRRAREDRVRRTAGTCPAMGQATPPGVVHRVRSPSLRRDALGAACPAARRRDQFRQEDHVMNRRQFGGTVASTLALPAQVPL